MKSGICNTALELLRVIDVPEIDFTDADEDKPTAGDSVFSKTGL